MFHNSYNLLIAICMLVFTLRKYFVLTSHIELPPFWNFSSLFEQHAVFSSIMVLALSCGFCMKMPHNYYFVLSCVYAFLFMCFFFVSFFIFFFLVKVFGMLQLFEHEANQMIDVT